MNEPWIAVAADYDWKERVYKTAEDYLQALEKGGGRGVLLAPREEAEARLPEWAGGLLLTGGPDLDPIFFGEETKRGNGPVNPRRDAWELALVRDCLQRNLPVLGICRGIQVMAVGAGGAIWQDLYEKGREDLLQHQQQAPGWYGIHGVRLEPHSRLAGWAGKQELRVNSFHHQAVKSGRGDFLITGRAYDGTVEMIERSDQRFWLGVQWHPERMQKDPMQMELFRRFTEACRR